MKKFNEITFNTILEVLKPKIRDFLISDTYTVDLKIESDNGKCKATLTAKNIDLSELHITTNVNNNS